MQPTLLQLLLVEAVSEHFNPHFSSGILGMGKLVGWGFNGPWEFLLNFLSTSRKYRLNTLLKFLVLVLHLRDNGFVNYANWIALKSFHEINFQSSLRLPHFFPSFFFLFTTKEIKFDWLFLRKKCWSTSSVLGNTLLVEDIKRTQNVPIVRDWFPLPPWWLLWFTWTWY